jgi:choline kinase
MEKDFNVIVLAAGMGSRLMPLTEYNPKCLVEVNRVPILKRQLNLFNEIGFSKKIIVTGYMEHKINYQDVIKISNSDYASTNMVYSLMKAIDFLKGDLIISYGDILYKREVLEALINSPGDIVISSDLFWNEYWEQRFDDPLEDAESFVKGSGSIVKSLGQKEKNIENIEGQFIGLIKLTSKGCRELITAYQVCKKSPSCSLNAWGSKRTLSSAYMTDLLNFLAKQGKVNFNEIERGWVEVDNLKDLEIANKQSWV